MKFSLFVVYKMSNIVTKLLTNVSAARKAKSDCANKLLKCMEKRCKGIVHYEGQISEIISNKDKTEEDIDRALKLLNEMTFDTRMQESDCANTHCLSMAQAYYNNTKDELMANIKLIEYIIKKDKNAHDTTGSSKSNRSAKTKMRNNAM